MLLYFDKIDLIFNILHIAVILINCLGWTYKPVKKFSLYLILITLFSWSIVGIFGGIGFCPITYLHSKYLLSNHDYILPFSYLDYIFINNLDFDISSRTISLISIIVIFSSLYLSLAKNNIKSKFLNILLLCTVISWILIFSHYNLGTKIYLYDIEVILSCFLTLFYISCILKKIAVIKSNY